MASLVFPRLPQGLDSSTSLAIARTDCDLASNGCRTIFRREWVRSFIAITGTRASICSDRFVL